MGKELRMMLLDTKTQELKVVMVEDELEKFYELLDCSCIDIVERKIGGVYYDIICDDEGLLTEHPIISAVDVSSGNPEPMLFGNLLICHNDGEGNQSELEPDDCFDIRDNLATAKTKDGKEYKVIMMEY